MPSVFDAHRTVCARNCVNERERIKLYGVSSASGLVGLVESSHHDLSDRADHLASPETLILPRFPIIPFHAASSSRSKPAGVLQPMLRCSLRWL